MKQVVHFCSSDHHFSAKLLCMRLTYGVEKTVFFSEIISMNKPILTHTLERDAIGLRRLVDEGGPHAPAPLHLFPYDPPAALFMLSGWPILEME